MKVKLLILLAFIPILTANTSCAAGRPIKSLCVFDFPIDQPIFPDQKICWVNRDEDIGFTMLDMLDDKFFGISASDLKKVFDKLNECKQAESVEQ